MLDGFENWLHQPFRADMSALDWFLFLGLLIIIMALWRLILVHITEAID